MSGGAYNCAYLHVKDLSAVIERFEDLKQMRKDLRKHFRKYPTYANKIAYDQLSEFVRRVKKLKKEWDKPYLKAILKEIDLRTSGDIGDKGLNEALEHHSRYTRHQDK